MERRYITDLLEEFCFGHRKMAFISGPRQVGKTTLAKVLLHQRKSGSYYNWDDLEFRKIWTKSPKDLVRNLPTHPNPLLILDEIHKARYWKRTLKGIFDTMEKSVDILVTGSAWLSVYQKGSDSLLGRYFPFRLHPFSLGEVNATGEQNPRDFLEKLWSRSCSRARSSAETLRSLLRFSGFPEPFLAQSDRKHKIWRRTRLQQVIREDLRDLSRIPHLSQIEMLVSLLPARVGSLLSKASLRDDLEVSFDTVKRWLEILYGVFYCFEIKPYNRKIPRTIRKEGKLYLWEYTEIVNEAIRFENLVACHLMKACDFWSDSGEGEFALHFLRNKEKQEIDFLITWDGKPWLPIEVKLSDIQISKNWMKFLSFLSLDFGVQLVLQEGIWGIHSLGDKRILVASASEVLNYFV